MHKDKIYMNYKQAINRILMLHHNITPNNCIDPVQHIFLAWLFSKKTSRIVMALGGGGGGFLAWLFSKKTSRIVMALGGGGGGGALRKLDIF